MSDEGRTKHRLRLFIAGQTLRSERAVANLRRICDQVLPNDYELQIVDVFEQPHLAEQDHVLVTPTVIKQVPPPARRVLGDLDDEERVLRGLSLHNGASHGRRRVES
jgi:circadian clock protein KaiB